MDKKKLYPILLAIVYTILGLLLGLYIKIISINLTSFNFFQVRMIDILQLLVPVFIALIIASLISKKVFIFHRRTELYLDLVSIFEGKIHKINKDADEYFHQKTKDLENMIVLSLKESSIELGLISNIEKRKKKYFKYNTEILKEAFFAFKKALTDTPFEDSKATVTGDEINEVAHRYGHLLNAILEFKLALFE